MLLTEPQLQSRRWPRGALRRFGPRRGSGPRRHCRRCHLPSPVLRLQSPLPKSCSHCHRLAFSPAADAAGTERHVTGAGPGVHAHFWARPRPHKPPLYRLQLTRSLRARPFERSKANLARYSSVFLQGEGSQMRYWLNPNFR